MMHRLKNLIVRQGFNPGLAGLLVNPFYFARRGLFANISALVPQMRKGRVLDVGCGSKPYANLFGSNEYVGLELNGPAKQADFFYDGNIFPFVDDSFDSVFTSQVFEHVFNPDQFLGEINRVVKKDGHLLITVPFIWDEHEQPYDFARYSSFGLTHIIEKHGFKVLESRKSMNDVRVIFQMINAYIYKKTMTRNSKLNLAITLFLTAPFNVLGEALCHVLPKNSDLYLDNVILAQKS